MSCDLYRHFDKAGNLLYVGISISTVSRLAQHRCGSAWYDQIARITVEKFASAKAASEAERSAIRTERPIHNKAHATQPGGKVKRGSWNADFEGVSQWSIRRWMICWTPDYHCFRDHPNRGTGKLIAWPDPIRESYSDKWPMSTGACDMCVHEFSELERRHFVMSTVLGMMHNGMTQDVVHRFVWPIHEYRLALPPDVKAPFGDSRFGHYAGDTEVEDAA